MGTYVYSLKSPKHAIKIKVNGVEETAAVLKYSHKPTWNTFDGVPRWQIMANARIARMEKLWQGKEVPRYVVVEFDKKPSNNSVLDWHSNGCKNAISTHDDPDWGGRKWVGRLDENYNVVPQ